MRSDALHGRRRRRARGSTLGSDGEDEHGPNAADWPSAPPAPPARNVAGGAGADEPRLRVDPLEGGRAEEADRPGGRGRRRRGGRWRSSRPASSRNATPHHLIPRHDGRICRAPPCRARGRRRTSSPPCRPRRPSRQGSPRHTPTLAPVAASIDVAGSGRARPRRPRTRRRRAPARRHVIRGASEPRRLGRHDRRSLARTGRRGLERSCERAPDWVRSHAPGTACEAAAGLVRRPRLRAASPRHLRHRRDRPRRAGASTTAAASRSARRGEVVVLHPDEAHDGRAGRPGRVRLPHRVRRAGADRRRRRAITGGPRALPFVRAARVPQPTLARAVAGAFSIRARSRSPSTTSCCGWRKGCSTGRRRTAGRRARRATSTSARSSGPAPCSTPRARVVRSSELEAVSGLTRYDLARQFRAAVRHQPLPLLAPAAARPGARGAAPGEPLAEPRWQPASPTRRTSRGCSDRRWASRRAATRGSTA